MARTKRRKRTRFTTITFKITSGQKKSLFNYCEARKTTPTKLIKKLIRPYLENFNGELPQNLYVTENQLDLFEEASAYEEDNPLR